ncbi:MAG TPA: histidinol dehydrogenase, partial [Spirochaetota bacterium]|nr:histidinol dehydrogenase [Spirochaetota bacterium]
MIPIKRLKELSQAELDGLFNRFGEDFSSIMIRDVVPIVTAVQKKGDQAVKEYTKKFDGVQLDSVMATEEEIENAYRNTSDKVLDAFKMARDNV